MQQHANYQLPWEIRGKKTEVKKPQTAHDKKEKSRHDIDIVSGHRRCKSGAILFSVSIFLPHRDFTATRFRRSSGARNFLRVSHLEVLRITMAAPQQPSRQPLMRYSTKCGLMLVVGGRLLFIAFQLETAAKSERRIERMLPFFLILENRLMRFMAYWVKKRNLCKYTLYVREYVFRCGWWLRFVLWIYLDYYTNFDF